MVKNGWIQVLNNSIIVKNPENDGKYARITPCKGCKIYVNGVEKKNPLIVKEEDNIEFELEHKDMDRNIQVSVSEDKLKAFITINYELGCEYSLSESNEVEHLDLEALLIEKVVKKPVLFSVTEIINELTACGITHGIKSTTIQQISKNENVKDILIAEGTESIEALDDSIEFLHNKVKKEIKDKLNNDVVDYKNLNKIDSVAIGDIIAGIHNGYNGTIGTNVYGENIIPKKEYHNRIICGDGCRREGDYVIATIDGQVFFKNNKLNVNKVYNVNSNVDITTGNINFHGDITVKGSVTEGMTVCAQNNIKIIGGAYSSNIISRGNTEVQGNIMNTRISAGGKDVQKELRVKSLVNLQKVLEKLIETVHFLKDKRIISDKQNMGVVIKGLIDTKFTELNKLTIEVMSSILKDKDKKSKVLKFIKSKLIGIAVLSIEHQSELEDGLDVISEEIEALKEEGILESDIIINYCQDAFIQTSGNIEINGKGAFTSEFSAGGEIIFTEPTSVCRGGKIKAKNSIKASIVGSEGGVQTVLEVEDKSGVITIDIAYNNTLIVIGNKQRFIDRPSKKINCYIDKDGELMIEKFVI